MNEEEIIEPEEDLEEEEVEEELVKPVKTVKIDYLVKFVSITKLWSKLINKEIDLRDLEKELASLRASRSKRKAQKKHASAKKSKTSKSVSIRKTK